jgi:glutamate racemase
MIGILDSGIGGKGIEQEVRALLPGVPIRYLQDIAHFPYGDKPPEEVVRIIDQNCGQLVAEGAKLIVLACNSASVVSLAHLRRKYAIPFVGVVPAVKPAASLTKSKQIAVFGTALTSRSPALQELIGRFCDGVTVHIVALPGLAETVEVEDRAGAREIVSRTWRQYQHFGIDVVVLGCTHYTLIREEIQGIVGAGVQVIDSNRAVAQQVKRVWERLAHATGDGDGR